MVDDGGDKLYRRHGAAHRAAFRLGALGSSEHRSGAPWFEECSRYGDGMVKEKRATIEEIVSTFSAHISKSFPSPAEFQERLRLLLENKRERTDSDEYMNSLEANIVFLHDLITEGEALLDLLLREEERNEQNLVSILEEMEKKVRSQTKKRHAAVFSKGGDDAFRELVEMKRKGDPGYAEKLEFDYLYLMTLRILLFEFFNVLASIKEGYKLAKMKAGASKTVTDSLGVTAHYYLGNVEVEGEPGAQIAGEPVGGEGTSQS
jgi:hypothetical protein